MYKRRKAATIQDVAAAAGVSVATVSRAINGMAGVRENTHKKVLEAIEAVGYVLPTALEERPSNLIVTVVPELGNPFYALVIRGIQTAAARNGYEVLIWQLPPGEPSIEEILEKYRLFNMSGLILMIPTTPATVAEVNRSYPVVQCCEYSNDELPYVTINNYQASRSVVGHLVSKGRKKIALINGSPKYKNSHERKRGYLDAMAEAGLEVQPNWIAHIHDVWPESVMSVVSQMLLSDNRPDALFTVSDAFGAAAVKAAKRSGLKLPEDLHVVGFDNTQTGLLCDPVLTTVNQPQLQMGNLACEMLIEQISNPSLAANYVQLDTELIVRESTM